MTNEEVDLADLRALLAQWGVLKAELDTIDHQIRVLEYEMGYTDYIGGPHLMVRKPEKERPYRVAH